MDLLTLLRLFARHKIVVAVASTLTVVLVAITYTSAPPVYRASGSVVLFEPPALPELPEGAPPRGPEFQNPFLQIDDMSVVVDILVRVARTSEVRDGLEQQGLNGTYTIGANLDFYRGPIVDIAAEEATPEAARDSARLIMAELGRQMEKLQTVQGIDPSYQIKTSTVQAPERATTVFSSALRRVLSMVVLGVMLIICSALLAEALEVARSRRRSRVGKRVRNTGFVTATPAPPTSIPKQPMAPFRSPPERQEQDSAPVVGEPGRSWSQSVEIGHDTSSRIDVEAAFLHDEQRYGRFLAEAAGPVDGKVDGSAAHPYAQASRTVLDHEDVDVEEFFRHARPPG